MAIVYATEATFADDIKEGTVLVDFYADWCGPCKMIAPVLEQIAAETDDFKIVKLNVDENMAVAQKYGVRAIPTLFVMKNGEVAAQKAGFMPKDALVNWVQTA
jgi:thioredoxin 1